MAYPHGDAGGGHLSRAFGVVSGRVAVRDGDEVVLPEADDGELRAALAAPYLNDLIELGRDAWGAALACDGERLPIAECAPSLPVLVRDYVDFYASEEHAANFGRIFRPGAPALPENWHEIPLGYHGRASSIVATGTQVRRPHGVVGPDEFAPTRMLDFECELGFVCGPQADIFGVVLVNDWSARDIQRFEYVPLGPFLGKSFATSMSAWVVPLEELDGARVEPRWQEPPPAEHLRGCDRWALDIDLEIELNGAVVSRPNAHWLYWTPPQMLAHMTSNGARVSAGDLFATGTISGEEPGTEGSLAEIGRGARWLADGDEVVLRGRAGDVELGEVSGRIAPA
ncbi:MAG: fumarylacetoacetase [Thermoleophilales bacterium]|nr:fumarylacetoacetase [Thermoleophilales bacterium]